MAIIRNALLAIALLPGCSSARRSAEPQPLPARPSLTSEASPALPLPRAAAVLELFTSEGCSSCPAADELLAELTTEAERSGRRVYTLELHVDYWNNLGWVDPFSRAIHSQRQSGYSRALGSSGLYTPQLVVNGREELVGSRAALARSAIDRALATPSSVGVAVNAARGSDASAAIQVAYRLNSTKPVILNLALAEDSSETHVDDGENRGRILQHRHVVRAFWSGPVAAHASGTWRAPWPRTARAENALVVAYAADPATLAVIGADARTLGAHR